MRHVFTAFLLLGLGCCMVAFTPAGYRPSYVVSTSSSSSSSSSSGGGGGYLVQEKFEGTGTPSGWTVSGPWNFDDTASPLEGTQSASCQDWGMDTTYVTFTDQSEVWGFAQFKGASFPSNIAVLDLVDSTGTSVCAVHVDTTGAVSISNSAFEGVSTTALMTAGTAYNIWFHYKAGSGTGIIEVAFSSTTTKPTSGTAYAIFSASSVSTSVSRILLRTNGDNSKYTFDNVTVSTSNITGVP